MLLIFCHILAVQSLDITSSSLLLKANYQLNSWCFLYKCRFPLLQEFRFVNGPITVFLHHSKAPALMRYYKQVSGTASEKFSFIRSRCNGNVNMIHVLFLIRSLNPEVTRLSCCSSIWFCQIYPDCTKLYTRNAKLCGYNGSKTLEAPLCCYTEGVVFAHH